MKILKNRRIETTQWLPDNASHPLSNQILKTEDWLQAIHQSNANQELPGLLLSPDDDINTILEHLDSIPVIAIECVNFVDGRVYSLSIELRHRYHFQGEIRALHPQFDNLAMMEACGINAFQFKTGIDVDAALEFFEEIQPVYNFSRPEISSSAKTHL